MLCSLCRLVPPHLNSPYASSLRVFACRRCTVLDSPVVRSMLSTARAALVKQALEYPDTPEVLILVEIATKSRGISVTHDQQLYNSYYHKITEAIGDRISSPEPGSHASCAAMVSLAPRPEPNAIQRGLRDSVQGGSSRGKLFADNVAYSFAPECRLGAFEVFLVTSFDADGSASFVPRVCGLHSKLWTRKFPSVAKLVRHIQHTLLPVFRRQDGDKALAALLRGRPRDEVRALRDVLSAYGRYSSPQVVERATQELLLIDEADAELREAMRGVSLARSLSSSEDAHARGADLQDGATVEAAAGVLRATIERCQDQASSRMLAEAEYTVEDLTVHQELELDIHTEAEL